MHFSVDTSLAVFTNLACNTFIIIQIKFILVSIMIASRTHKLFRWVLKGEVLLAFHCCFLNISSFSEKTPSHPLLPGSIWFCTGKDCTFWMRRQDAIDQVLGCYKLLYFLISDLLSWLYCSSFCQYPPSSFFKCWCGPDSWHRFMCVRPRDSFVVCRHLTDRKLELVGVVGGCMEKWA